MVTPSGRELGQVVVRNGPCRPQALTRTRRYARSPRDRNASLDRWHSMTRNQRTVSGPPRALINAPDLPLAGKRRCSQVGPCRCRSRDRHGAKLAGHRSRAQPSSCTMIRLRWISSRSNWTAAAALADCHIGRLDLTEDFTLVAQAGRRASGASSVRRASRGCLSCWRGGAASGECRRRITFRQLAKSSFADLVCRQVQIRSSHAGVETSLTSSPREFLVPWLCGQNRWTSSHLEQE